MTPRPCSVADALAVIGEKWSLLVIRELAFNIHRFDAIAKNTGAPRDILTSRLRRLETAGIVEKRQYQERPVRFEYHLTQAGDELRPVLLSIAQWGDKWVSDTPPTFRSAFTVAMNVPASSIPSRLTVLNPGNVNVTI